MSESASAPPGLPPRSPMLWAFMARQFTSYLRRNMNALRVARWGELDAPDAPLVVYSNHPSWWDAALFIVLGKELLPSRASYAPIDAKMLEKYKFFGRIGAFGLDLESRRGAVNFLHQASAILASPERALWITAQGTFKDVRERPIELRPGVAHLAERVPDASFVPLAIDYCFWSERGAEALVAFGRPIPGRELTALPRNGRLAVLEQALTDTMNRLAGDAISRDPARFRPIVEGRQGIGGIYDLWRGARARLRGERFQPGHLEQRP
ncbi:MAG TPA: lysophospholipid acyltransferase family protein [Geminicoccus sp.]|jgi:1-acyl-sn-glycerol-3-phosphate acyltransferase|uniref:lysophospholipid acyltransferase family protein n=1 Tax=Geminicoccus sp. TaxID=2024832 RepID=UPI002E36D852|nr:lysophospholipid acyltransferase family protein [Geminicoccus sp.]HEX2528887.1 lysophospholipid acyltransferase family protein [Geminicoccus sp.]